MFPSIHITLLAAVVIGADLTITDAEFQQTMTASGTGSTMESSRALVSTSPSLSSPQANVTIVTVQFGSSAYLPCNVLRQGNPVSWVRVRDGHIITVDQTTFIADQRFQSIYAGEQQRWSLQIKYAQVHDMGLYECQISTDSKMRSRVYLKVVVPKTELIGDHIRFVKAGSKVALHCIVRDSIEPPSYIIWLKGNQQIEQNNVRGWYIEIDREIFGNASNHRQNTIGSLIIPSVNKRDSGNYTCSPSNSAPVTVDLHVLNGEYSASAIMSSACMKNQSYIILLISLIVIIKVS